MIFVVYLLCAVMSEICEMVLILTKDTVVILVGEEKIVLIFFHIFLGLCDTL